MPVTNKTNKKLVYTYLPSIDARPSKKITDWYTLLPGEEAIFTDKLNNNFVNFWVGEDYPWEYFYFQCTGNLEKVNLWYGPLDITHPITISNIEKNLPVLYNMSTKLSKGYGAVTSFESHKLEPSREIQNKGSMVLTIWVIAICFVIFVSAYVRFLL